MQCADPPVHCTINCHALLIRLSLFWHRYKTSTFISPRSADAQVRGLKFRTGLVLVAATLPYCIVAIALPQCGVTAKLPVHYKSGTARTVNQLCNRCNAVASLLHRCYNSVAPHMLWGRIHCAALGSCGASMNCITMHNHHRVLAGDATVATLHHITALQQSYFLGE
jgi:hypothetical protein